MLGTSQVSANQAAQMQLLIQSQHNQQILAAVKDGRLNRAEFADLALRTNAEPNGFGKAPVGDPNQSADAAQAQSIYNRIKADADGFKKLYGKYTTGDHHPSNKQHKHQDLSHARSLFSQLKGGKVDGLPALQQMSAL